VSDDEVVATDHSAAGLPTPTAPSYRTVLRRREFRGLVGAQVLSEWGDEVARVALALLVLDRTDSAFLAAFAFAVSYFPAVVGSALLGSLADRLPRRTVLLVCDVGRAAVLALIALLAVPQTPVWLLLALLLAAETFTAPFTAARMAVVPDVLPDPREYVVGTGLLRVLTQLDQVVGLALGGAVVTVVGARWALAADAATFLLSAALLRATVRGRPASAPLGAGADRFGQLVDDLKEGWHLVFGDASRRALVLLGWGAALFLIAPEGVALAYARDVGAGDIAGAILLGSVPAGAAIGAVLVGRWDPRRQTAAILPLATCACLPLLATSVEPPVGVVCVLWLLSGICQGFMVTLIATVNLLTPPACRGRVNGLAAAGFSVASGVAFLGAGWLADLTSPAVAVTVAGVVGLAMLAAIRRSWPQRELMAVAERVYVS
jgi:MFS family permease